MVILKLSPKNGVSALVYMFPYFQSTFGLRSCIHVVLTPQLVLPPFFTVCFMCGCFCLWLLEQGETVVGTTMEAALTSACRAARITPVPAPRASARPAAMPVPRVSEVGTRTQMFSGWQGAGSGTKHQQHLLPRKCSWID